MTVSEVSGVESERLLATEPRLVSTANAKQSPFPPVLVNIDLLSLELSALEGAGRLQS